MLTGVMQWWLEQMAALLPRRTRGGGDALIVAPDHAGFAVIRRRRGQERRLGTLPAPGDRVPAWLRPARRRGALLLRSPARPLQRDVVLPLAAQAAIDRVLGYEMDRLTPFRAADVVWTWALLRRDAAAAQLHLRLWLLPRAALQPALEALARLGLAPDA
ncbi:MAG: hypothetical protein M0Z28_14175, partial [Rhodospirillales bacterium]|nr:hypothetical protein [Rhodospirillales bacterium]